MKLSKTELWQSFQRYYREYPKASLALDFSRMDFTDDFLKIMEPRVQKAFADMAALEKGSIANPDENRMVGHYWLRNPELAPSPDIRSDIKQTIDSIKRFAADIHSGKIVGTGGKFQNVLVIGIGGSALGPQFVASALGRHSSDKMRMFFFDNTDPDGMDTELEIIGDSISRTICIVISKSGGTKETRNGMLEAEAAYARAGLSFAKHAVAITMSGSELDNLSSGWIAQFPMWDWVGGRTSELSAVGLLPAALQGLDIDGLLGGAKECDISTRCRTIMDNPAAMLSLSWYFAGSGEGKKSMVVLPYKDRLGLFAKYLQQLVMESLGKEMDLDGKEVHQGLTVFGNKGATDQHSYVQQLRDGLDNFFAVFIEVLKDRNGESISVEPNTTTGDFLNSFLLGTREALYESGRNSVTITIPEVSAVSVGALIALFERSVGLYANLINVNAYHQPGVQAGKVAADSIIRLQSNVLNTLQSSVANGMTAEQIANHIGASDQVETIFKLCEHLSSNSHRSIMKVAKCKPSDAIYFKS